METFIQSSNAILRKRGYRLTPQRHMILSVIQNACDHLSIEQITERVQQINPYVSLSTIYRTLELLKNLDLIQENHARDGQSYYETVEGHAHHHLICQRCQQTIHLDKNLLGNLNEQLQQTYQYHQLSLNLVATGYCDSCWRKLQKEAQDSKEQPEQASKLKDEDNNKTLQI